MTLLLDTQVAIWWLVGSRRLGGPARKLLAGSACVFSAASVWEVAIKHRLGKLSVAPALFRDRMIAAGAELLMVSDTHAIETAALPRHHDDPFDRMLIAQARVEKLRAISADKAWRDYELDLATV
ncbi:MAG: twitching motility protein PilT [Betaproteobacteria bacterium RIFCSPLOWO2_02_FULL_67_26]|nr:MAG: twitching motility protein PilT [Betaproteobacteria bacterium RIFCSPLOWO2_02_FULL_67_26]